MSTRRRRSAIDATRSIEVGRVDRSPSAGGVRVESGLVDASPIEKTRRARLDRPRESHRRFAVRTSRRRSTGDASIDRRPRAAHRDDARDDDDDDATARATCSTSVAGAARRRPTTRRPARARAPRARSTDDADDDANDSSTSRARPEARPVRVRRQARQDAPDEIKPGFDTAEGGKVGPVGTFLISALLIALFGGSFFFTSVPRGTVEELAARQLADDPNAPTQSFARR